VRINFLPSVNSIQTEIQNGIRNVLEKQVKRP